MIEIEVEGKKGYIKRLLPHQGCLSSDPPSFCAVVDFPDPIDSSLGFGIIVPAVRYGADEFKKVVTDGVLERVRELREEKAKREKEDEAKERLRLFANEVAEGLGMKVGEHQTEGKE